MVSRETSIVSESEDDVTTPQSPARSPYWWVGILCGVLAALIYSVNTLLVKMVTSVGALQLSASRYFMETIMLLPYITYNWRRKDVDFTGKPGILKFLLLRAVTGSTGTLLLYQAIQRIPVGDAVTLQFTSIIFATVIAFICLSERPSVLDVIIGFATIAGVALISKPSFLFGGDDEVNAYKNSIGVGFGVLSGFLSGSTMVALRKLGKKTHPSLNILYCSLIGSFSSFVALVFSSSFQLPCQHDLPYIFLLGATGIGGQIFLTVGLQYERAAVFPVIRSMQIVLVYVMQITILHDVPSLLSACGSALIFTSIFGITLRKLWKLKNSEPKKKP